ncbi:MAG: molybdopterin molybdotransferase MoeA [Planctomycetota bacterium]
MCAPRDAVAAMIDRVEPVASESIPLDQAPGRILVQPVTADRDSPAADVSAMDGYALRLADWNPDSAPLPVAFEVRTGHPPPPLPPGHAAKIFTGGVIPDHADTVIQREHVHESPQTITRRSDAPPSTNLGKHIRRRGENAHRGDHLLPASQPITAAAITTLASVGLSRVKVHRPVRVAIATTGNELGHVPDTPSPDDVSRVSDLGSARIRDSNGPSLRALLLRSAWCEVSAAVHISDDLEHSAQVIGRLAQHADLIVTTGGVSMGDHDHIPAALQKLRAQIVYHHLSMRPGKPNLGAVLPDRTPVFALPGNPVSVLVGAVVLMAPVLRRLAGFAADRPVRLTPLAPASSAAKPLPLWHYRLACFTADGLAQPLEHRGSGDVAAVGRSDGCFELPPHQAADAQPRPWFDWRLDP